MEQGPSRAFHISPFLLLLTLQEDFKGLHLPVPDRSDSCDNSFRSKSDRRDQSNLLGLHTQAGWQIINMDITLPETPLLKNDSLNFAIAFSTEFSQGRKIPADMRPLILRMNLEWSKTGDFGKKRVQGVAGDKDRTLTYSHLALY